MGLNSFNRTRRQRKIEPCKDKEEINLDRSDIQATNNEKKREQKMTPKVSTISKKEFKVFAAMSRENKNKRSFVSLAVKFCQQKP